MTEPMQRLNAALADRYRIERELGAGGMATVYLAADLKHDRKVAYASDESGSGEIYVRPFPEVGTGRWQVSIDGGRNPRWAHSGRELFFEGPSPDHSLMAVAVQTDATFAYGTPAALFDMADAFERTPEAGTVYRVAPDDQRFLLGLASTFGEGGIGRGSVVLVNNFSEELKRLVPKRCRSRRAPEVTECRNRTRSSQ